MREIEIIDKVEEGSCYDEEIGNYKVISEGLDDITIIKHYRYKKIKKSTISTLSKDNEYLIEVIENCEKYIVRPMDTIHSISKKFGKTTNELKSKNNLSTDKLFIGQILKI